MSSERLRSFKICDLLIYTAFGAVLLAAFHKFYGQSFGGALRVKALNENFAFSFAENRTVKLDNGLGGFIIISIEGGKAKALDANCQDKLCLQQGPVSVAGGTIVCLPNRIMIWAGSADGEQSGIDAATY